MKSKCHANLKTPTSLLCYFELTIQCIFMELNGRLLKACYGLNCALPQRHMRKSSFRVSENSTLFGNGVVTDIIS